MANHVTAADRDLLNVAVNHCAYRNMAYIWPGQETLLGWYNKVTGRTECLRTLNYRLRRLEDAKLLKRIRRSYNDKILGHVFQSTIYVPLRAGLALLEWFGIGAFKIMKEISKVVRPRKRRARRGETQRARLGTAVPMGAVVGEVMKGLKGT